MICVPTGELIEAQPIFFDDVVARHLPALHRVVGVAEHVVEQRLQREPAHQRRAELAVTGEQPVRLSHREGRAQNRRFFAERPDVETDAALTLQHDHALVDRAGLDHAPVELDHVTVGQTRIVRRIERSVVTQHTHYAFRHGGALTWHRDNPIPNRRDAD